MIVSGDRKQFLVQLNINDAVSVYFSLESFLTELSIDMSFLVATVTFLRANLVPAPTSL